MGLLAPWLAVREHLVEIRHPLRVVVRIGDELRQRIGDALLMPQLPRFSRDGRLYYDAGLARRDRPELTWWQASANPSRQEGGPV